METLVVAQHNQHRNNQYFSRGSKTHGPIKFGSFDSPPLKDFRGINCRTFQSGAAGLLPTPVAKQAFSLSFSPRTPSPSVYSHAEIDSTDKGSKKSSNSCPISIPDNIKVNLSKEGSLIDELSYSERWAGPAYSNSPPPSSLPLPKFSLRPKRTVSLDLPVLASDFNLHPVAKSAPPSPTRERNQSTRGFFQSDDDATKTLRRILNLDITDE